MVIDGKLSLTKLNAKIARLELRAEQYLIHYRCLERHSFEARAERDRLRVMLLHLSNFRRQRDQLKHPPIPRTTAYRNGAHVAQS